MHSIIRFFVLIIKNIFHIENLHLFARKKKKMFNKLVFKKKYSTDDLITVMCKMGMRSGSIIFIHSSMSEFYNYEGSAHELINKIIDVIGSDGTLMMPAYPMGKKNLYKIAAETNEVVFDVNNTPSGAGYLSEVFRTYPGVKRSINLQHSVCAYGKLSDHFLNEHHLSEIAWDSFSPYYKLAHSDGLIFSLGLTPYLRNVTMIHCIEANFRHKYQYFASFFGRNIKYNFLDQYGNMSSHNIIIPLTGGVRSAKVIKRYFDKQKFKKVKLSNLNIEMVESNYMYNRCVDLTEKGIPIYVKPSSKKYIKNRQFAKVNETEK